MPEFHLTLPRAARRTALAVLALSMLLAGCAGTEKISLESRNIALEPGPVPATGGLDTVSHLLPATGPTYVTLNVKELSKSGRQTEVGNKAITSGSGYVVDGSGIVMTAAHVAVEEGNEISARAANGRVYTGKVIAINPANDMAIIKLRGFAGPAAVPALPGCLARNDLVFTLGRPHAQSDTARIGRLESRHFGRAVAYGKFGYPDALVLSMGTQKGESGGPLFDGNGKLIGMVVSTLTDANGNLINLAHAIPATALAKFLCSKTSCSAPWAAIATQSVDSCDKLASQ